MFAVNFSLENLDSDFPEENYRLLVNFLVVGLKFLSVGCLIDMLSFIYADGTDDPLSVGITSINGT